jgi:pyrroline-5-carboxylate reductase
MATALIRGMLRVGSTPDLISASDPHAAARAALLTETGAHTFDDNLEVVERSDVVVLAVKPQILGEVMAELRPAIQDRHLVVSVAAGVTLASLTRGLGVGRRIVRAIPNTPALVGEGAAAYCLGESTRDGDDAIVRSCLDAVGRSFRVPERLLDAATGLAGSGPAFVFVLIEALADGGVRAGLPREIATTLAAQTVLGAARMVLETGKHPGQLKDEVASPGGTTIAGLHALERAGARAAMMDAVDAAARRSSELAAAAEKAS